MNNYCIYVILLLGILLLFCMRLSNVDVFTTKVEAFTTRCEDDPKWFSVDSSGNKHYCKDIGTSTSCYDRDSAQREGWERCLKTCGNCANTKVSQVPMNNLAMFSGDPVEDFGVVLGIDKSREFVTEDAKKSTTENSLKKIINTQLGDDVEDMTDRLEALEDMFDLLSGNVHKCKKKSKCSKGNFPSCNNQCLKCPKKDTTKKRTYIKTDSNGNITLPAVKLTCDMIGKKNNISKKDCVNYSLFESIGKDEKKTKKKKGKTENKPSSLYDMCPHKCGAPCKI